MLGKMQSLKSSIYKGPREINPQVKFQEIFPLEEVTHFEKKLNINVNPSPYSLPSSSRSNNLIPSSANRFGTDKHFVISFEEGAQRESDSEADEDILDVTGNDDSDDVEQKEGKIRGMTKRSEDDSDDYDLGENNLNVGLQKHQSHRQIREPRQNTSSSSSSNNNSFLSLNESFVVDVKRGDVILDAIVFVTVVAELLTTITLISWYYHDGQNSSSMLTTVFLLVGNAAALHQFNLLEQEQIKRLFDKGKRIRILVNCFPPLATILSSFQCVKVGYSSLRDSMVSSKYLEIENFAKHSLKTQSFFQAAPQSTLQLILLIEALDSNSIGLAKAIISITCIITSLTLMTNGSLPSKAENNEHLRKTTQRVSTRIFVGIRMFSNFASRSFAVTSLFVSARCIFGPKGSFTAVVISIGILLVPRVIFTFVEFLRQFITLYSRQVGEASGGGSGTSTNNSSSDRVRARSNRNQAQMKHGLAFYELLMGYLATIFFPVGYPLWVFLYTWCESCIFVLGGNIIGWYRGCLINAVNAIYTGTFLVLFIIIPVCIPYANNHLRQRQRRRRMEISSNLFNPEMNIENDSGNHKNDLDQNQEPDEAASQLKNDA